MVLQVNEDYGSFEPTPEAQKKVDELIKGCKTEGKNFCIDTLGGRQYALFWYFHGERRRLHPA